MEKTMPKPTMKVVPITVCMNKTGCPVNKPER